jgi:molybdopterin-guanine dinucleotide biosynthesis protein MobB
MEKQCIKPMHCFSFLIIFRYNRKMSASQSNPFILGFYGHSGVGKTYLIRHIVSRLTAEKQHVAVVKISNQSINLDTEGKDTYLYGQAGAETVVFSSTNETTFLLKKALSTRQIVDHLLQQSSYDFIFVEGALEEWIPKIRLGDIDLRPNTLSTYDGNFEDLYQKIRQNKLE